MYNSILEWVMAMKFNYRVGGGGGSNDFQYNSPMFHVLIMV